MKIVPRYLLTHRARVEVPGAPVPDGDGGFTEAYVDANPPLWWCAIESATARNTERQIANTVEASSTHTLRGDFHPGITTLARVWIPDPDRNRERRFDVIAVQRVDEERFALVVSANEYISDRAPAVNPLAGVR